jgi:solute carrier family 25 carnitine/acylcarnitine transporter 20/29
MVGPMELVRIRLQTQKDRQYSGPIDCIRKIYRDGGIKSFYRGLAPTIGRVANGMGYKKLSHHRVSPNDRIYFLCFETLMRRDTSRGIRREDIPNWRICLYGALYYSLSVCFVRH